MLFTKHRKAAVLPWTHSARCRDYTVAGRPLPGRVLLLRTNRPGMVLLMLLRHGSALLVVGQLLPLLLLLLLLLLKMLLMLALKTLQKMPVLHCHRC